MKHNSKNIEQNAHLTNTSAGGMAIAIIIEKTVELRGVGRRRIQSLNTEAVEVHCQKHAILPENKTRKHDVIRIDNRAYLKAMHEIA